MSMKKIKEIKTKKDFCTVPENYSNECNRYGEFVFMHTHPRSGENEGKGDLCVTVSKSTVVVKTKRQMLHGACCRGGS